MSYNTPVRVRNYRLGRTIGIGSFGKVKLAEHDVTGLKVAIKILNRRKIAAMGMEDKVWREINILKMFRHPHIIRLYEVIETPTDIYVVMEYVSGGEMFDYIVSKGRLPEDEARRLFQQVISGVEYCHRHMVVHRDLKPENLLLDAHNNIKIADFGLANIMADGVFLKTSCGSPNYAAPEVISGKVYAGAEVDVWSCGVILYSLLCSHLPFDDDNVPNLFRKIKGGVYTLPSYLTDGPRSLISKMLSVDPLKRITLSGIWQHWWFLMNLAPYLVQLQNHADEPVIDMHIVSDMSEKFSTDAQTIVAAIVNQSSPSTISVSYHLLLDHKNVHTRADPKFIKKKLTSEQCRDFPEFCDTAWRCWAHCENAECTSPSCGKDDLKNQAFDGTLGVYGAAGSPCAPYSPSSQRPESSSQQRFTIGVGLHANPKELMAHIMNVLSMSKVRWRKQNAYSLRCVAPVQRPDGFEETTERCLKFSVELFKTGGGHQAVDFRRLAGDAPAFLELAALLVAHLQPATTT